MLKFEKLNHFQKFSLTSGFDIDPDDLENRYLTLQKKFHPDNAINQTKEQQDTLALDAIALNEAYKILKNPVKRAVYLLKLQGINLDEDNCPVKPDEKTLTMVLELREKLFAGDTEETAQIKDFAASEIKKIIKQAAEDFEKQDYENAARKLIKVKYLDKILLDLKKQNN